MSNITEKEIEQLAEEKYPYWNHKPTDVIVDAARLAFANGYKTALQNKVSDEYPNKDDIIKEAKRLWKIPNKLESVKLVKAKLGYSLKHAKAYCEDNFDRKVSDISAEEIELEAQRRYAILEKYNNLDGFMKREAFKNGAEWYASIVNEKNENIPADFKQITGHDSPKEMMAYEKGREDEQQVIIEWIEKWDGSSNSAMGTLLKKKFDELFTCRSKQTNSRK